MVMYLYSQFSSKYKIHIINYYTGRIYLYPLYNKHIKIASRHLHRNIFIENIQSSIIFLVLVLLQHPRHHHQVLPH